MDKESISYLESRFSSLFTLIRLEGGRNNQVYKLEHNHKTYIIKKYFFHEKDPRDRLFHERAFYNYANEIGLDTVATLVDSFPKTRIGIYSYLEGRKPNESDVTKESIQQFIQFFQLINGKKHLAKDVPLAVDAALCINDYFSFIERRLDNLLKIEVLEDIDAGMISFLEKEIIPFYKETKDYALKKKNAFFSLKRDDLCLSPSDFGFHNVVIHQKKLRFFDFEYAGFDDPVNLLSNFFCQPKISVPYEYFSMMAEGILEDETLALERFKLVYPLCRIKWSLLVLNLFLEVDGNRRNFARAVEDKVGQLALAQRIL